MYTSQGAEGGEGTESEARANRVRSLLRRRGPAARASVVLAGLSVFVRVCVPCVFAPRAPAALARVIWPYLYIG